MSSFLYSNLSKDLSLILDDSDDYNVLIQVGENENTKEFRAHSVILRARSPYFKGALSSHWITKKNDMIMFNKPNITPNIFDIILRYIYTGSENCDRNKWDNEDYEALKGILNKFFPLIRFMGITPNDFNDKIKPYKDIIPKQIYKEIENFYYSNTLPTLTLSPRIGKLDSRIIKPKLAKIIINWIDKKDFFTLCYKFDLIYRGSIDGINNESFKNKCKGHVESLVLIKVKKSEKIFGEYSSVGFHTTENDDQNYRDYFYHYSLDNFNFSFENDEDTQHMKISRVINYDNAMYEHPSVGFVFGVDSLIMTNNNLCVLNRSRNYENNLNTKDVYNIEEVETFIVTKQ
ncbi:hypothetical protein RclHR1_04660005 [Rhizophagus clarus]|uniref:BTB domain-containing protein n=1 Tax=Rhizophagus clarus TaxID=94130 RepID=A0A2Z6S154_9GLOM|nr:hypothetical protein RclHR1_04660005 [Rhizophagus clarus]